jgi:hypothetical protein
VIGARAREVTMLQALIGFFGWLSWWNGGNVETLEDGTPPPPKP